MIIKGRWIGVRTSTAIVRYIEEQSNNQGCGSDHIELDLPAWHYIRQLVRNALQDHMITLPNYSVAINQSSHRVFNNSIMICIGHRG